MKTNTDEVRRLTEQYRPEILYEACRTVADSRPLPPRQLSSPKDTVDAFRARAFGLEQEHMWVAILDTRNGVIDIQEVYKGTLNSTTIRIGELFKRAIRLSAGAIIVCHNHPSGNPAPSPEDIAITRHIMDAGVLLDIPLLDHIVITDTDYCSIKAMGLIPEKRGSK